MDFRIVPKPKSIVYAEGFCEIAGAEVCTEQKEGYAREGYGIAVAPNRVTLSASTEAGLFYANITLGQLKREKRVPCGTICDEPQYSYRGFMFDCARHFFELDEIKRMLDAMAELKLNIFHWHLTEDQGFRLDIEKSSF